MIDIEPGAAIIESHVGVSCHKETGGSIVRLLISKTPDGIPIVVGRHLHPEGDGHALQRRGSFQGIVHQGVADIAGTSKELMEHIIRTFAVADNSRRRAFAQLLEKRLLVLVALVGRSLGGKGIVSHKATAVVTVRQVIIRCHGEVVFSNECYAVTGDGASESDLRSTLRRDITSSCRKDVRMATGPFDSSTKVRLGRQGDIIADNLTVSKFYFVFPCRVGHWITWFEVVAP